MVSQDAPPINDSVIELDAKNPLRKDPFYMSKEWVNWILESLVPQTDASVQITKVISLGTTIPLSAAISTSSAVLTIGPGLYRVGYIIRVTQAASTSSALQVTIGWVRNGVAMSSIGVSQTGNAVTTFESKIVNVRVDGLTDITYAVAYTSVGGTPMKYEIDVIVEQLQ